MNGSAYKISDEPTPGYLSSFAVNPVWPFVAIMFSGVWLSWSWFIFNSIAVGSPTKRIEWLLIGGGLIGGASIIFAISMVVQNGWVPESYLKYLMIILIVWKLGVTYALYYLQNHTIELYEFFGGTLRNGLFVAIGSIFVSDLILGPLPFYARVLLG
jgi:hypothetical protein